MKGLRILCLVSLLALVSGITVAQDRDISTELFESPGWPDGDVVMLNGGTEVEIQYNVNDPQPFQIGIICDGSDCPYGPRDSGLLNNPLYFSMCGTTEVAKNFLTNSDHYTDKLRIPRSGFAGPTPLNCAPGEKTGEVEDQSGNTVYTIPSDFLVDYKTSGGTLRINKWDEMKYWRLQSGGDGDVCIALYLAGGGCDLTKQAKTGVILTPFSAGDSGHTDKLDGIYENSYGSCGGHPIQYFECDLSQQAMGSTSWGSSCNGDCPLGHLSDDNRPEFDLRGEIILSDSGKFHICDSELNGFKFMDGKTVTSSGDNFAEDTFECQNDRWEPATSPVPEPDPEPIPDNRYEGCTDGSDTDGDGLADSADPGCVKPFNRDGDEADYRDTDMTATFGGSPSASSASVSQGGATYPYAGLAYIDGKGGPNSVIEFYNKKGQWSKSPSGSTPEQSYIQRTPGTQGSTGSYYLQPFFQQGYITIDAPYSSFTGSSFLCGNGERNTMEDNFNCPKDFGMPDDVGDTYKQSDQTITDTFSSASNPGYDGGSDDLKYDANLEAYEASGSYSDSIVNGGSDKTYDLDGTNGKLPDPYMGGDPSLIIRLMTVKKGGNTKFGTSTDYDLTDETANDWPDYANGYINTECDAPGANASCDASASSFCTRIQQNTVKDYTLPSPTTETHTGNTKEYYTTSSKPGIGTNTRDLGIEVTVSYNPQPTNYDEKDADNCGRKDKSYTCDYSGGPGPDGDGRECSVSNNLPHYGSTAFYPTEVPYNNYESSSTSYYYENLKWHNEKFYSTDPSKAPNSGCWQGDPLSGVPTNNAHYWSVLKDTDSFFFGNDEAVASSEMKVTHNGNDEYWCERTWYGVFDADGSDGTGDSYVPVGHAPENEPFNAETGIISSSGDSPGFFSIAPPIDFVTAKSTGCGEWFCVSAQDVKMQNLDQWGSPTNPATGYKIDDDTKGVSKDYSVCRTFQELIGGVDESYLRCQYDDSRSFPEGPTASYPLEVID